MTITRIGATKKYTSNWAQAFGKKKPASGGTAKRSTSAKSKGSAKKK